MEWKHFGLQRSLKIALHLKRSKRRKRKRQAKIELQTDIYSSNLNLFCSFIVNNLFVINQVHSYQYKNKNNKAVQLPHKTIQSIFYYAL